MEICKANKGLECIKCMPGGCGNRAVTEQGLPITDTKIPMPPVKEPKKSIGGLTVDVEVKGLDEAIKKAEALKKIYTHIDTLQQRIIKGAEKISTISSSSLGGRPEQSYMEYMDGKKI